MTNIIDDTYEEDEVFGARLLISTRADFWELKDNVRAARSILTSFPETSILINGHRMQLMEKNPEYTIDDLIGDRKGIETENGIKSAFRKSIAQGCKAVVIDLDMHLSEATLKSRRLSSGLYGRRHDFLSGTVERCYVVYRHGAVLITRECFESMDAIRIKKRLQAILEELRA